LFFIVLSNSGEVTYLKVTKPDPKIPNVRIVVKIER